MNDLFARRAGRILNIAYIAAVATILVAPAIGVRSNPKLTVDNRAAAKFPELSVAEIPAFPRQFEAWFNDRFGGREDYIAGGNFLILQLFRESPNERVILGRDGFFFLASHRSGKRNSLIWHFFKFDRGRVEASAKFFVAKFPALKRTRRKVLFLTVPTKHLLYFDRLPSFIKDEVPDRSRYFPAEVTKEIVRRRPDAARFFADFRSEAERVAPTVQLIPPANFHWTQGPHTRLAANLVARHFGLTEEVYVPKREDYRAIRIQSDLRRFVYRKLESVALKTTVEDFGKAGIKSVPGAAKMVMPGTKPRSPVFESYSHYTTNPAAPGGRILLVGESFTNPLRFDMARYWREVVSVEYSAVFNHNADNAREDLRKLIACWRPEYIVVVSHANAPGWIGALTDWLPPDEKAQKQLPLGENIFINDLECHISKTAGFGPPEPQGCWAERKVFLELQLPRKANRHIRLTFAGRPIDAGQKVEICDRRKRPLKTLSLDKPGQYSVDIPRGRLTADNKLILFFDFPNARKPEGGDGYPRSFFFDSIKLSPLDSRLVLPLKCEVDFTDLDCYVSRTEGFYWPESIGIWAGRKTSLELQLPPDARRNLRLTFTGRPIDAGQKVGIYDRRKRLLGVVPLTKKGQYGIDIPRNCLTADNKLILFFDFPNARKPGTRDTRILSFFFQSLELTPLDSPLVPQLEREIDFTDLDCYVSRTEGFYWPEAIGIWAGRKTSLELQLPPDAKRDLRLTFSGLPLDAEQTVGIYDRRKRLLGVVPLTKKGQYGIDIPRDCLTADNKLILFFDFPNARKPGTRDTRILSFFFYSIKLSASGKSR